MAKNEVVQKTENKLSTQELANEWGVVAQPSQDMLIPKILPMQLTSVLVSEGKALFGEFRDSINGNLFGTCDKPFEFVPFYIDKAWDMLQMKDGQFQYVKSIPLIENPLDAGYNDNLPRETQAENDLGILVETKYVRRMNVFVLLSSEIKSGTAMPYVISFKSTSIKEGKKLYTQMYVRNIRSGLPPAAFMFTLSGVKVKNDKGSYMISTVSLGRQTTTEELTECLSWLKLVRKGAVKVDTSDAEGTASASASDEEIPF